MPIETMPVIARISTPKGVLKKRAATYDDVTLFFPHDRANRNRIMSWERVGQHGEADLGYLQDTTRPAGTVSEKEAVAAALAHYARECPDFPVKQIHKLPQGWQDKAWKQ